MSARGRAPWIVYALAALLAAAIAGAVLVVGPTSSASSTQTRIVTAQRGVVQSTVSGSGNVQAASELNLGFKTSGTVARIHVEQGQHVGQGQLLATLDPQSAEVTLEQARASLQSAQATLAREEETHGESSASSNADARAEASASSSASPAISSATREANIASARAAVKSDRLAVEDAERSVADTRLTAPESGTIVSLGGEVGETVSGEGTSRAASESSASSSGLGGGGGGGLGGAAAGASSSSNSSSSSSQSSSSSGAFAVLSDLSSMKLVVPLSESEVGSVRRGQPATVTVEALKGAKLAAHVSEVAALPTSNSGVVSYDVTFTLDQLTAGLKPGMSATAEVVVQQAEGVSVPSTAISGGAVTIVEGAKQVRRPVTTGLAGNSMTIVLSGLRAGERVALPLASGGGRANLLSRLGSRRATSAIGGRLGGGFAGGGFAAAGPRIAVGPGPGG